MNGIPDDWALPYCPAAPEWALDWKGLLERFRWLRAMEGVPQDPVHHAEGDVLIHTRMVVEALIAHPSWRALPPAERSLLFAAALLHDVAKPATTRVDTEGHITALGHARQGERMARTALWSEDFGAPVPFACREAIARLVRFHGLPLWFLGKPSPERAVIEASLTARNDLLALLAEADARGRYCADQEELLLRLDLYREMATELDCLTAPRRFPSDQARFVYFRTETPDLHYVPYDDTTFEVVMLSGLPGVGKDTWIRRNLEALPVVSLDTLRRTMGVSPEEAQGSVVNAAKEQARVYLREKRSFVWNATNVTRQTRKPLIDLFAAYHARIRLIYLDAPLEVILRQDSQRPRPVTEAVIRRLMQKVEVPDATEAHRVELYSAGSSFFYTNGT